MKKILQLVCAIAITFGFSTNSYSQISLFPNTEGFEAVFDTGLNVTFIPNWEGNEVRSYASRVFPDNVNFHNGAQALGMIPTSTFNPTVIVKLNLTGISNMTTNLWAKSELNGTGTRSAVIYVSASIDGGLTYGPATIIGDSVVFANASTSWANYFYPFPSVTNNQPDVRLKIIATRGIMGTGTAARFIADDFTFIASSVDSFPPAALYAKATALNSVEVLFSEPVDMSAENVANYTGLTTISSAVRTGNQDLVILTLSTPLTEGQLYTLNVANVSDINGNPINPAQDFTVVFNDNTGNVKMTEIMYNNPGNDSLEFVEVRNLDANAINVGGWKFSEGLQGYFPSGLTIQPNQYVVFSKYPMVVDAFFGITSIAWDPTAALNNAGERISIINSKDILIDSVGYGITTPWDSLASGYGYSLTLCNESADNDQPQNWSHSLDSVQSFGGITIYATPDGGCITIGVDELNAMSQISTLALQPNPSSTKCEISFVSLANQRSAIILTDINGRELVNENLDIAAGINSYLLNTVGFENGIYILRVGERSAKLVIQQ